MAFKLVENNLSPMQRSRSQVKKSRLSSRDQNATFLSTLQHSSKYRRTPTIFFGNVVTVSLCSSSQGRESLQKREAQHALLLQRINYQSQAQQRNRNTLFIRQVWSQLHIQNAASISKCFFKSKRRKRNASSSFTFSKQSSTKQ